MKYTIGMAVCALSVALLPVSNASSEEVVIAGGADIIAMNAIDVVVSIPDRILMDHISDTLLIWESPGQIGPGLATSWRNIDEYTWEFELREGVVFHNGEPFNAEAVQFTYHTLIDPDLESPGKSNHAYVQEVEIVDDYTVRLITKEPFPVTLPQVTFMHMMPPEYFAEVGINGYRRHPIGTGPYKFVEHVPDSHVRLEHFEDHWMGEQRVESITYRVITEDATRVGALLAGEVDMALNVPAELTTLVEASGQASIKSTPSVRTYLMQMNGLNPDSPVADRLVREAINYAVDREALSEYLFAGTFEPASWMTPAVPGYNPDIDPFPHDPERARELLAEAGYPDGIDIELDTPHGRYLKDRETAEAIAGQLAEAGIRTTVNTYEFGVFTNRVFEKRAGDMILFAWALTKGDAESHLRFVLHSGGSWNLFHDEGIDDYVERINTEMDTEKRVQLIKELQEYQQEVLSIAYLMTMADVYGVTDLLEWWQPRSDEKILLFEYNHIEN